MTSALSQFLQDLRTFEALLAHCSRWDGVRLRQLLDLTAQEHVLQEKLVDLTQAHLQADMASLEDSATALQENIRRRRTRKAMRRQRKAFKAQLEYWTCRPWFQLFLATQHEVMDEEYSQRLQTQATAPSKRDKIVSAKVELMLELLALRDPGRAQAYSVKSPSSLEEPAFYPVQRVSSLSIADWAALTDPDSQAKRREEWSLAVTRP
jgi:hypothetical protein